MSQLSTRSTIHRRLCDFVGWIEPSKESRTEIKSISDKIRDKIRDEANNDGLTILETPYAGSFQKKTGLKRYMRGHSAVEGQDIDIPFVVKKHDKNGNEIRELVNRFHGYVKNAYPEKANCTTKSSISLSYNDVLAFDIVPLLETGEKGKQILIRTDGERRETSVLKHTEFIQNRTSASKELAGRVSFNECVRLVKWWRYFKQEDSGIFDHDDNKVPSFLIDLLCANAFDTHSVKETYAQTISNWFGYLHDVVMNKKAIIFTENYKAIEPGDTALWKVYDPINPKNNVVRNWNNTKIQEFATWFSDSNDDFIRAIAHDLRGNDIESMSEMVKIFGNPLKNNVD